MAEAGDPFEDLPGDVGDNREKFVRVTLGSGESVEHGDVYFRYTREEFIVSPEESFPDEKTTWYDKGETARVEVLQHHAMCFITTAVAGDGPTLDALRDFRDDALGRTRAGRALVAVYYAVSPPVAATLERHPDSLTAGAVRRLVWLCARLARARRRRHSPAGRLGLSLLVTLLYVVGLLVAVGGHLAVRAREVTG